MTQHIQISVPLHPDYLALAAEFFKRAEELANTYQIRPVSTNAALDHTFNLGDKVTGHPDGDLVITDISTGTELDADIDNLFGESEETATGAFSAEQVQAAVAEAKGEPTYEMTELAEGFTLDEYIGQGWTLEQLIDENYVKVIPFVPAPAVAAPLRTAPAAPKPSSPKVAPPATTSAGTASGAGELDAEGLPWDSRIHSGEKTRIANNTWKVKRGTAPELVTQVKAELRALLGNSKPAPTPPKTAPAPGAKTAPAPAAPAASAPANACALLMRKVSAAIRDKTLTQADMLKAIQKYGIAAAKDLNLPANAAFIPLIENELFPAGA